MTDSKYEIPVSAKIVQAQPGVRAVRKGKSGDYFVGETIIAFIVGCRQEKYGDIWPWEVFTTPVTFSNENEGGIHAIMFLDGSVDAATGETFKSFDDFRLWSKNHGF